MRAMGERFPSAEAFYEILKRGSGSAADDHLHAVIEFCGLLADGGPRCGAPVGSAPLRVPRTTEPSLQPPALTLPSPHFLSPVPPGVAVQRVPRYTPWPAP